MLHVRIVNIGTDSRDNKILFVSDCMDDVSDNDRPEQNKCSPLNDRSIRNSALHGNDSDFLQNKY